MAIGLTDEMREALDEAITRGAICILATASADGEPNLGFRGSMMVFDTHSLAFWERGRGDSYQNLSHNPQAVVVFRDRARRQSWKFHGTATILEEGPLREAVLARTPQLELDQDPERRGCAVLIRVDRVTSLRNEVLQQAD